MKCAYNELLRILPPGLREGLTGYEASLLELRLRLNRPAELVLLQGSRWLDTPVTQEELSFCLNAASRYSPWAAATVAQGFLTAPGGHRLGICGQAVVKDGRFAGIRQAESICIRVARDFPGIARTIPLPERGLLILGAPGWGKTTVLRDFCRKAAEEAPVAVVDERQELFPPGFNLGRRMDILSGCPKTQGIEMVLRTMSPAWIGVDEITAGEDCRALLQAFGCGVRLIATAHAAGMEDFRRRRVYAPLGEQGIFDRVVILHRDKTFHLEAMDS